MVPPAPLDLSVIVAGLPGYQLFDSLAVDGDGNVCVATLINGGITVISPVDGSVTHVPTGDLLTTNICFGDHDGSGEYRDAYITVLGHRPAAAHALAEPGPAPQLRVAMAGAGSLATLMGQRFYVETLGCPKNQVDSDKLVGTLLADGMAPTDDPSTADLVVVNTCAFIDEARKESIDTILALEDQRKDGARARGHRLHGRALRRRAGRGAARGRPGGRVRRAGERPARKPARSSSRCPPRPSRRSTC